MPIPWLHADTIVRGGRVWTGPGSLGPDAPTAVAIHDARILAVGDDATVSALAGPATRIVEAEGRRVVPGLIDSHLHLVRAGLTWSVSVDWSGARSLREALAAVADRVAATPPGAWVRVVGGWGPGQFDEGRMPTVAELDAISDDHPIYVQYLYESALVNRAGRRAIGMVRGADDPPGGSFDRGPDGEPTGVCRGVGAFSACLAAAGRPDHEAQVASTAELMRRLNRCGITGVIDPGGMGMTPESYRPIHELWRRGGMTVRTRLYLMPRTPGAERQEVLDDIRRLHPGFGDDWLRLVGAGEMVSFGFFDLEGVRPFEVTDEGAALLEELLEELLGAGWSIHLHAVMTRTITRMLDVIERVLARVPIDPARVRVSLAHIEPITDDDLDRMARLGIGAGIQDRMVLRAADSAEVWGEDVVRRSPPLRGMLDRGIVVGGGTDATAVSSYDPWRSLWWLVTGRTQDGGPVRDPRWNMTREEALTAYTSGSAWLSLDEHRRGRIEPGMLADLAILTDDYFEVSEDDIPAIESFVTIVGGDVVHAAPDADIPTDR